MILLSQVSGALHYVIRLAQTRQARRLSKKSSKAHPPIIIHSEDSTSISQAAKHDTDLIIINKDLTACQNKEKFLIGAFYDFGKNQVALMGTVRKNGFLLVKCI